MRRRILLIVILILTFLVLILMYLFNFQSRCQKYIVDNSKWNEIMNHKSTQTIKLESIKFNGYPLIIDQDNSTIYYSMVESVYQYNPKVKYVANDENIKLVINNYLDGKDIKVMIYNDKEYKIYSLVVSDLPMIDIDYNISITDKVRIPMNITVFDNNRDAIKRVVKSEGTLKILDDEDKYVLSFYEESLGNHTRKNHISILGMVKEDEYVLSSMSESSHLKRFVNLFINNEYQGIYAIEALRERSIDRVERRKEVR